VTREEKAKEVAWLHEQLVGAKALFLTNFRGLNVEEMNALRSEFRNHQISYKVLKNTLVRLASKDTDFEPIVEDLVQPRAAAWATDDESIQGMAKVLIGFAKTHQNLELVSGVYSGKKIGVSELDALSKLPSREEMLATLLGTMNAPLSAFVGTLAAVPRSFLGVLKAIEEQKNSSSETAAV
jgi:large subunit ribosomal protein L10